MTSPLPASLADVLQLVEDATHAAERDMNQRLFGTPEPPPWEAHVVFNRFDADYHMPPALRRPTPLVPPRRSP